jgi:transposase
MRQALLPLIPRGAAEINDLISVVREEDRWTYFHGTQPVFQHRPDDTRSFRMFTSQLCSRGSCTQAQIIRAFGVSKNSVLRNVAKYEREGIAAFYRPRKGRGPSVMTADVRDRAQKLLDEGQARRAVAKELEIHHDTLRKAIERGDLLERARVAREKGEGSEPGTETNPRVVATDKSSRSEEDAAAGDEMGIACTRVGERVMAAAGVLAGGATTLFETCRDVSFGGVLCALPSLAENGLFRHLETLPVVGGYYMTLQVILLLAYMALCRIKTVEQLQYEPAGELGTLMGLDRIPEVRCLRKKLSLLTEQEAPEKWAAVLSREWMEHTPELAGSLYVDGHVRLYHGDKTELPRRFVSRQRLCLRGTTDYWVNDTLGQPFFSVERPIDHGMLEALSSDIVPRLLQDVPSQPTAEQLEANPYLSRFLIIFDREGYSPAFFRTMWQKHRVGCITYHKYPKKAWPESLFTPVDVTLPTGEVVSMKLAEMGSWIGSRKEGLWVSEVRKLAESGHQTSLISTAYDQSGPENAARLFSRWSQENFFRYMMEHFAIDALSEYATEEIPGTHRPVVNPRRRTLDGQQRSLKARLTQLHARFGAVTLHPQAAEKEVQEWETEKTSLREQIEQLENEVNGLKELIRTTPKHIAWDDLPAEDKFQRLAPGRKRLTDTVKLVAYRAETAMAMILRQELAHVDDARSMLRDLFRSDADLYPDEAVGILEVRLHTLANPRSNRAIQCLLDQLNAAEFTFPGTHLRFRYAIAGSDRNREQVPC